MRRPLSDQSSFFCQLRTVLSGLRRWEWALILSLSITFCHGAFLGPAAAGAGWWGVIFPGLAWDGSGQAEAASFPREEKTVLRFWLGEWLAELFY